MDLRASAQFDSSSRELPMEVYIEEVAEIFTQDWFEFEEDCIAEISDPISELHNEIFLIKHDKEELDHIMATSEADIACMVRCELDKLRSSIFEELTLDPSQLSFERTKTLDSLDSPSGDKEDSGKIKKKKKGIFETLRFKKSAPKEDEDLASSPTESNKKGFTNKIKNFFKLKRNTSPKPARKNGAAESSESEEDLQSSGSDEQGQ